MKPPSSPISPLSHSPTPPLSHSAPLPFPHFPTLSLVDYGVASRALPGEPVSGDLHVVQPFGTSDRASAPTGVLVAAMDALGHGDEAAAAARIARATLEKHAHESVVSLIRLCHQSLNKTRGVVMGLASFNALDSTMTWLGVGNIEGILLRADTQANPAREALFLRGGVVGYQLPPLRAAVIPIAPGDTLIFATDGIQHGFTEGLALTDPPQQIANFILTGYGKETDDALVLVARYLGGEA